MVTSAVHPSSTADHAEHVWHTLPGSLTRGLRKVLTTLHVTVGALALVGGAALVFDPSGAPVRLSPDALSGFTSFLIPGVLLMILGVIQFGAAVWSARPGANGVLASQWAGALLVLWIAFETALVGPIHWLQGIGMLVGAFIYIVAHELHHDEPHETLLP